MPSEIDKPLPLAQQTAPERIYLDIGARENFDVKFSMFAGVTWSADNATDHGIEYVRADLAQAVPVGYRLVPVEPTIAMCIAGDEARITVEDVTRTPAVYRAMLSAAPQTPSGGECETNCGALGCDPGCVKGRDHG